MMNRRLHFIVNGILCNNHNINNNINTSNVSFTTSSSDYFKLGTLTKHFQPPTSIEHLPIHYTSIYSFHQDYLAHLYWLLKKDLLHQDVYLLGNPGAYRSELVLYYCQLLKREVSYLLLSNDTSELDLKQRREIWNSNIVYMNSLPVECAIHGRILLLDGMEKVERNVLPMLNNLLENREMALEDGRFLMSHSRYDELLTKGNSIDDLNKKGLIRVHPNFRVIALGLPVPKFAGMPLDPPLRSRFQARNIDPMPINSLIDTLHFGFPTLSIEFITKICTFADAIRILERSSGSNKKIPHFPDLAVHYICRLKEIVNVDDSPESFIERVYPYPILCYGDTKLITTIREYLKNMNLLGKSTVNLLGKSTVNLNSMNLLKDGMVEANYINPDFKLLISSNKFPIPKIFGKDSFGFVESNEHTDLIGNILLDYYLGRDVAIIGAKGSGKSSLARLIIRRFGLKRNHIYLYKDMTSRDLLQYRTTNTEGNTIWKSSSLINCAITGDVCILDGLDRISAATLSSISSLIHHRDITLFDGTRLLRHDRYDKLIQDPLFKPKSKIIRIHPSFRIISLASLPLLKNQWLSPEVLTLFSWHEIKDISENSIRFILNSLFTLYPVVIDRLLLFRQSLESTQNSTNHVLPILSLRQMLRVMKHVESFGVEEFGVLIKRVLLFNLLPVSLREIIDNVFNKCEIMISANQSADISIKLTDNSVSIGNAKFIITPPKNIQLVPKILFFNIPAHVIHMGDILKDVVMNENILIIGTQGVGKNKIVDRLLENCQIEREYMQLHRDTSVLQLTCTPTLINDRITNVDSPLVRAMLNGRCAVLDEADKAPLETVAILKGLVEDGEMRLSDGRVFKKDIGEFSNENIVIKIHPSFRLIVLANKAGYPFLGNDFFRECGDVFSCHVIENPDRASELMLLRSYAPMVSVDIIDKICSVFASLRKAVEDGLFSYPYSTREAVAVCKHLQAYPDDGLIDAFRNVLAFDAYNNITIGNLQSLFGELGIPLSDSFSTQSIPPSSLVPFIPIPKPILSSSYEICNENPFKFTFQKNDIQTQHQIIDCSPDYPMHEIKNERIAQFSELLWSLRIPLQESQTIVDSTTTKSGIIAILVFNFAFKSLNLYLSYPQSLYRKYQVSDLPYQAYDYNKSSAKIFSIREILENQLLVILPDNIFIIGPLNPSRLNFHLLKFPVIDPSTKSGGYFRISSESSKQLSCLSENGDKLCLFKEFSNKLNLIEFKPKVFSFYGQNVTLMQPTLKTIHTSFEFMNVKNVAGNSFNLTNFKGEAFILSMNNSFFELFPMKRRNNFDMLATPSQSIKLFPSYENTPTYGNGFDYIPTALNIFNFPFEKHEDISINRKITSNFCISSGYQVASSIFDSNVFLTTIDIHNCLVRHIPLKVNDSNTNKVLGTINIKCSEYETVVSCNTIINKEGEEQVLVVISSGKLLLYQVNSTALERAKNFYTSLFGVSSKPLRLELESDSTKEATGPKVGKVDSKNDPHTGGNTWRGGTGGSNTAGLGGKGGPYRVDAGHNVTQLSDAEKKKVIDEVAKAAREMGQRELLNRLKEIDMSPYEAAIMLEVSTMIMEALIGFETRFEWCMVGHSGDGIIPLVEYGKPPKNEAERLKILKKMSAHSQYCNSGDSTVFATKEALKNLPALSADEHLFFLFSDANFRRYDIDPIEFGKLLVSEPKVTAYAMFIASMEQEAKDIVSHFPQNAYLCMETSQLPHQFKQILSQSDFLK